MQRAWLQFMKVLHCTYRAPSQVTINLKANYASGVCRRCAIALINRTYPRRPWLSLRVTIWRNCSVIRNSEAYPGRVAGGTSQRSRVRETCNYCDIISLGRQKATPWHFPDASAVGTVETVHTLCSLASCPRADSCGVNSHLVATCVAQLCEGSRSR